MDDDKKANYHRLKDYYEAKKAEYEFFIVAFKFFLMVAGSAVSGWMALGNILNQAKEKVVEATGAVMASPQMAQVNYTAFGKHVKAFFWIALAGWLLYSAFKVIKKKQKGKDGPDK